MANVLLITADQLRYDALACNGNPFVQTPNLDALADSGVRFTMGYTPNPICVPARASITTGNYSHRATKSKNNEGLIHDGQNKIAEVFGRAGYETYAMGKLHYVPYSPPGKPKLLHGFQHAELAEEGRILAQYDPKGERREMEEYIDYLHDVGWAGYSRAHGIGNNDPHPAPSPLPAEHHVDSWVATRTIDHLKHHLQTRKNKPFFMWMSFVKPHPPFDPPRPYDRLYDPREILPPLGSPEDLLNRNPYVRVAAATHGMPYLSPEAIRVMRAHYHGMVTFQDKMIGRVMNFLADAGLSDDTIVVYTADHGDLLGDFGGCAKCNFMEGAAHVPFIFSAPGQIPAGTVCNELVGLQDALPTLAALTNTDLAHPTDGKDLTSAWEHNRGVRDVWISQCLESPWQSYMARDNRWKYCYSEVNSIEELYDLETDPGELQNLAGRDGAAEHATRLRKEIIRWCLEHGDHGMINNGNLVRTDMDLEPMCTFNDAVMGWRWY